MHVHGAIITMATFLMSYIVITSYLQCVSSVRPEVQSSPRGGGGTSWRYCNYYLRGYCSKTNCRYAHVSRESVPDSVFEAVVVSLCDTYTVKMGRLYNTTVCYYWDMSVK